MVPLLLVLAFVAGLVAPRLSLLNAQEQVRYFPETRHTVRGVFLKYWEEHGGLAQQGYPLTEEFVEESTLDPGKSYTVQYFERAVFEHHPENAGTPFEVLLTQLGKYELDKRYPNNSNPAAAGVPDPGPSQPPPPTQPPPAGSQRYSGTGQQAVPNVALKAGLAIFRTSRPGSGYFGVTLLDSAGKTVDLIANETTANFTGAHATRIPADGAYVLQVEADSAWTVTVEQPLASSAQGAPTQPFTGRGPNVTPLFTLRPGLATFQVRNQGSGYFGVLLLDSQGKTVDLIANSTDTNFSGSKAVRIPAAGAYLLAVDSDGDWSISVSQ
jgi:hypothetical protein